MKITLSCICHLLSAARGCRLPAAGYRNFQNPISYLLSSSRRGLAAAAVMALALTAATGWGQFSLTNTNYTQSFDGLGTGNSTVTGGNLNNVNTNLNGWYFLETGSSANTTITAGTGSANTGETYNLGTNAASNRTLGQLRSANLVTSFGFYFSNSLGASITNLIITYKGETWRVGATGRADSMTFAYNSTATALNSGGTWTAAALGFTNNSAGATASGSLLQTVNVSNNIAVTITNGGRLFLRWTDVDATSSDDAIGINDFTLTAQTQPPTITGAATATAFTTTYGTASAAQTFSVSGSNLTANLVATAPTGFEVSSDGTTYGSTATFTQSAGSASGTLRIRLAATAGVSGSYNSQNIVLSSTGATSVNITTASSGNAVSKKALTITAGNQTVSYGTAVATVTGSGSYTATGFVNGDTASVIGGTASYTTTYTTTTAAGSNVATITPVTTSLTATNYSFSAANGNVSVTAVVAGAPSITSITPGNGQLSVAFSAPASNGGASITNYSVS